MRAAKKESCSCIRAAGTRHVSVAPTKHSYQRAAGLLLLSQQGGLERSVICGIKTGAHWLVGVSSLGKLSRNSLGLFHGGYLGRNRPRPRPRLLSQDQ